LLSDSRVKAARGGGALAVVVALALNGCVQVAVQEPWDPQGRYVCEDGKTFTVAFRGEGSSVTVAHDGGQYTLPQTIGGTDAKYSDGRTTLYLDGPRALLEAGGHVFARGCVKQ
jgi:membrane-bound inhibitor of C-type lysozyme